jgi:hypothetical protein
VDPENALASLLLTGEGAARPEIDNADGLTGDRSMRLS